MPISNVNWLWMGNRPLLDPTPNTSITVPQREAILGYKAEGGGQLEAVTISGSYTLPATGTPNGFATVWSQQMYGYVPTQFSYTLDGAPVSNVQAISAFGVTMRIQTAANPDVFQVQAATLVQMSNGDMFFRPNANALGGWDSITRVHSIEVVEVNPSVGASYGAFNHTIGFKPEIFEVDLSVCYLAGTRILTDRGNVAIEELCEGDMVVCRFGGLRPIRWVGRQHFAGTHATGQEAVRFAPSAIADTMPREPLFVSPGHSMLVGETLVLAADLVNGITITREQAREEWSYFQIDLGDHDLVLANGAWSETFADCGTFRSRFDNFAEFRLRFPDHVAAGAPALCAPRPDSGPVWRAALQRSAKRALALQEPTALGPLEGRIEAVAAPCHVTGWALDADHPGTPVMLEVVLDGQVIGTTCACTPRKEARNKGAMDFVFEADHGLPTYELMRLVVRRAQDGQSIAPLASATLGELQGHLDLVTDTGRLEGWARDTTCPDKQVLLEIVLGDEILGTVLACRPRPDLAEAGLGNVAFVFEANRSLSADEIETAHLRRISDRARLRRSDKTKVRLLGAEKVKAA